MTNSGVFNRVAVLCGGWSSEREISLNSGESVVDGLRQVGVSAFKIDLCNSRDTVKVLYETDADCVFIALHGKGGEDGIIQGILDLLQIPYTGSGALASAMAMNKLASKRVWMSQNLPTPAFAELHEGFDADDVVERLGLPLVVKPIAEGSSIGVSYVKRVEQLAVAWQKAVDCSSGVFAEKWITGEEYSVAFVGERVFPPVQLRTNREFYDYQAKYQSADTQYICPAQLGINDTAKMQALAYLAADTLQISGWGRVDLRCDKDGVCWLLEANTVPGMTAHSLVPMSAKADNLEFSELTLQILATAGKDHYVVNK